jgi:hypothetical protein
MFSSLISHEISFNPESVSSSVTDTCYRPDRLFLLARVIICTSLPSSQYYKSCTPRGSTRCRKQSPPFPPVQSRDYYGSASDKHNKPAMQLSHQFIKQLVQQRLKIDTPPFTHSLIVSGSPEGQKHRIHLLGISARSLNLCQVTQVPGPTDV